MKKIISLLLSIFIIILCIPCSNIYGAENTASLLINFCDEDGTNNKHIIYGDDELLSLEWDTSKDGTIDGLSVVAERDEKGIYTYTIQISKDIDLYFNTFLAKAPLSSSQENRVIANRVFSDCIRVTNAAFKIESVDGDHTLNIHYLSDSLLEEGRRLYCIYVNGPENNEILGAMDYDAVFGGDENKLTMNFTYDNYNENVDNPIMSGIYVTGSWSGDQYHFDTHFNNLTSVSCLTGCYFYSQISSESTDTYIENDCDLEFTHIDPTLEYPYSSAQEFDRGFMRFNGNLFCSDSKINAYLNEVNFEVDDKGIVFDQIPSCGIAASQDIEFHNCNVHMEGIAALATHSAIVFDNTKADMIGRLVGIIVQRPSSNCIQYTNPGSNSYLSIETLYEGTKCYDIGAPLGVINAAVAIVPSMFNMFYIQTDDDLVGSISMEGDDFIPLNEIQPSDYQNVKRVKVGSPYDFEFRYNDNGVNKSSKYYKGKQLKNTDNLPQGLSFEEYNEKSEYPYVLTVDGDRTINIDVNHLEQVNSINQNIPVGFGIYFTENLLIQGKDENSKLTFVNSGDAIGKMFSYDIVSGDVNQDVKLKIDIPYLHFQNNIQNFDKVEFGTGSRGNYDYPNLFNISSYNIEINGVKDGLFTTSGVGIEYLSNLSIANSSLVFEPIYFICKEDDTPIIFITTNTEAEASYTDFTTCYFNGSNLTFDGAPLHGTNLIARAVIASNFIDISKGDFAANDSNIIATNANFLFGPAKFEDCSKLVFNNDSSPSSVPNIISCGGTLSFINSNYELRSKNRNIELWDYFDGPDFKIHFDQDEVHTGSFTAGGDCSIYAEDVEVTKSSNTDIQANTMLDGAVNVPYNNDDRNTYKFISVNYLPPLPSITEIPLEYPTLTKDGHIPYYYDEGTKTYYEDPYGQNPIPDLDKWLSTKGRIPSLKEENKESDLNIYSSSTKEIIKTNTIKTPVNNNDYLFASIVNSNDLLCVMINNSPLVLGKDYTLIEGDVVTIKFSDELLNSLSKGTNKIYIVSKSGFAYMELKITGGGSKPINPSYDVPKTGIY